MGKRYPMLEQQTGSGRAVLQCDRVSNTPVGVRPPLPGAVIVVHGVNDVGVSYEAVEQGLCAGLHTRMGWSESWIRPAGYRMPSAQDNDKLEADPDAIYFKRRIGSDTYSPVIPFYWGYREVTAAAQEATEKASHGQCVDRYNNRLDKDMSKGGGPFANATTTLPDMWNSGAPEGRHLADQIKHDPYRPIQKGPGRMYMILAAQRLAALIGMIRYYDEHDVVSIVAHSQGCLVSLLAQAFLLQAGERPADTLILNNPPYSLQEPILEALPEKASRSNIAGIGGGRDAAMADHYEALDGQQTMAARVDTLARIVNGIHQHGSQTPWTLKDTEAARRCGLVGAGWDKPKGKRGVRERDNRGKVYLYFSPEDMTVGLRNIQGIGWQGVPNLIVQKYGLSSLWLLSPLTAVPAILFPRSEVKRAPLDALGKGFFQRVFTMKSRWQASPEAGCFVERVGLPPHRFLLRDAGENDQAHVLPDAGGVTVTPLPEGEDREISGEELPIPIEAELNGRPLQQDGKPQPGKPKDAKELPVDPVDAQTALISDYGREEVWQLIDDPQPALSVTPVASLTASPRPELHRGLVAGRDGSRQSIQAQLNQPTPGHQKGKADQCEVLAVFACMRGGVWVGGEPTGKLLIKRKETPNEAQLRHQHLLSANSFHSAIFGGASNHQFATAYDVAVGGGSAVSHPLFYAYLCAVADWRLKQLLNSKQKSRPGILTWSDFMLRFSVYWSSESPERKKIIQGNCGYYSMGILPELPLPVPGQLPPTVVCETVAGTAAGNTAASAAHLEASVAGPSAQWPQAKGKP